MNSDFKLNFNSTKELKVPKKLINQVIGQDHAIEIARKAALQKRNVLLIGLPGTGKSMIAQAMAELMPITKLFDVLVYANKINPNNPKIKVVKAGQGKKILESTKIDSMHAQNNVRLLGFLMPIAWFIISGVLWQLAWVPDVVFAAMLILGGFILIGFALSTQLKTKQGEDEIPKLIVDNTNKQTAPFVDATGAKTGSLLGNCLHDPLQSGGLGTPAHQRIEAGTIHLASGGILFIDEIATLSAKAQQELLTAMQEKKYSITGQSELSSGSMVRTEPVPCDFVLVAAGNYEDLKKVHPALRSRIRGYGYEIYLNLDIDDNEENRMKIAQFIAQEVIKDNKIPHFNAEAVKEIIFEAKRRSGRKNKLTLKLRDLGGLVRAAGDIARQKGLELVGLQEVIEAKKTALSLEQQIAGKMIEFIKDYEVYQNIGSAIGKVNGLALLQENMAGIITPIEARASPAASSAEGKVIATGKLGEIAKEAIQNVSAIIKMISGKNISKYDLHVQFLQTYPGGVEGDSASISVATAVISAIENIPVRQDLAMSGSLSVRGEVLPVGGINDKIEAAIKAGFKEVIIPKTNQEDIIIQENKLKKIKIIPVSNLPQVLKIAFAKSKKKQSLLKNIKKIVNLKELKTIKKLKTMN